MINFLLSKDRENYFACKVQVTNFFKCLQDQDHNMSASINKCCVSYPAPFLANVSSSVRLSSVCLFVCLSETFMRPTQAIKIFGNVSMPFSWPSVSFR